MENTCRASEARTRRGGLTIVAGRKIVLVVLAEYGLSPTRPRNSDGSPVGCDVPFI